VTGGAAAATVVATVAGCALAWGGLVVPALKPLYSYAWFVGFFAAGLLYWLLSAGAGARETGAVRGTR